MAIISMPRKTLIEVDESTILGKEKLHVRWKNMARYCPNDYNSDESKDNDDEDE